MPDRDLVTAGDGRARCAWCGPSPDHIAYHDDEWGVPVRDRRGLFECLTLEGAQAGLSWLTILRKRAGYARAFAGFDPAVVAAYDEADIARLCLDPGIVRHRGKIEATVNNARRILALEETGRDLVAYFWGFVEGVPIRNDYRRLCDIPTETALSRSISKDLKALGFRFVGPTTVYAFMQAVGMVDDHLTGCYRHRAESA